MPKSESNISKKRILKSSGIIASASVVSIVIGLVKSKVLAVYLGPTGIGLMAIITSTMAMASTLFGLGVASSGVRQIAYFKNNVEKIKTINKSLKILNVFSGGFCFFLSVIFREELAEYIFQDVKYSVTVVIIATGVFFTLMSNSRMVLLQGFSEIFEIAKVKILASILSLVAGLCSILLWKELGIPFLVISLPVSTFLFAYFFSTKLSIGSSPLFNNNNKEIRALIRLGSAFMFATVVTTLTQFLVRYIISDRLGIDSVGYFQAAWAISATYLGFILSSMAADYYPRLSRTIDDRLLSNKLVNEQLEIALKFSLPFILILVSLSNVLITILYSSHFNISGDILKWQVIGDIFKIASWPLGYILLAKNKGKAFFTVELSWNIIYLSIVYVMVDIYGVKITGYAFFISYFIYFVIVYITSKKVNGFNLTRGNLLLIIFNLMMSIILVALNEINRELSYILAIVFFAHSLYRIYIYIQDLGVDIGKYFRGKKK